MSAKAIIWAGKQRTTSASHKLVLWALADCANDSASECWPSLAAIVEFTQLDLKTTKAALRGLKDARLIADTGRKAGRTKQIVIYKLAVSGPVSPPATGDMAPPPRPPIDYLKQAEIARQERVREKLSPAQRSAPGRFETFVPAAAAAMNDLDGDEPW